MERRPNEDGQAYVLLKDFLEVGRPTSESLKGPELVGRPIVEALNGVKACGGLRDCRGPDGEVFGIQLGSFPPTLNFIEITDEALMEEAFRYTNYYPCSLFSFGKWDFSSSSTLSGRDGVIIATDGGSERGYGSKEVGGADLGPLRVILVDGREAEVCDLPIRANGDVDEVKEVGSERVFQEVVEEMD